MQGAVKGSIARTLAAEYPKCEFVGTDLSPIGIAMAAGGSTVPPNVRFQVGNLQELPFESGRFQFVYSQSVIEHVADWRAAIREMYRVVAPGGSVLIRVGNGGRDEKHSAARCLTW